MRAAVPLSVLAGLCALISATMAPSEGDVFVFGSNENGHLGVEGKTILKPTSVPVLAGKCIKHSAVTDKNAIYVTCDGKVFVSGLGVAPNGALSMNAGASAKDPVLMEQLNGYKVAMVGAGEGHFIALTNDNKVFTWGSNHEGQLGFNVDVPFTNTPLEVSSLSDKNIRLVAAGGSRSAAITDDGRLYIWGSGTKGEMGDGTTRSHHKPTLVEAFIPNDQRVCQVTIGTGHVAAVTNGGDLYTWGDGTAGQLGLGDFGIQTKKPTHVSRLRRNVCYVTAGNDFTAVVTQDERVFLWGSNGYPNPFEKSYFQGKKPRQIVSGNSHMAVLTTNGRVSTWGSRRLGQAGREFSGMFQLDPDFLADISNISQITTGEQQTIMLSSGFPAPSLCSCLGMWFGHWRTEEKYLATCTEHQTTCGDDSCCGPNTTCCAIDDRVTESVSSYRAIDEVSVKKPSFACMPAKDAVCCGGVSGISCPAGFKCNLEHSPKRCEPSWVHAGMSDEDVAARSEEPYRAKELSSAPGAQIGKGVCGPRKETCPDDTCCSKGQSCCPMADGSFGCCNFPNAQCCGSGCCAEGYECNDEYNQCVKKSKGSDGQIVTYKQDMDNVESHCGNGKQQCPDRSCCAVGTSCCVLSDGYFGCCPHDNGVCCIDGTGCCPHDYSCDVPANECVKEGPTGKEVRLSMKSTPRNTPQRSPANEVMCPNGLACQFPGTCCDQGNGQFSCCDFVNGTCCAGGLGCCPASFECDVDKSQCKSSVSTTDVPMKFMKDPKPARKVETREGAVAPELCKGQTKCSDDTCCALGATCCLGKDGKTSCCDYMNAVCCEGGGCCSADHMCDEVNKVCRDATGTKSYALLPEVPSSLPSLDVPGPVVSNPGKCYPDEMKCDNDFCCPRGATCCTEGFGAAGCCPHTHGVCCNGGGCCPMGSECDASNKQCYYPNQPSKQPAPMLSQDTSRPPESVWDQEECWDDEQTCSIDAGCCLKSETCCVITLDGEKRSACCPFADGVCCEFGGCCPSGGICDEEKGSCISGLSGQPIDGSPVRGSETHPLAGLTEIDCPDGAVCGPFDTCCSLGFDEGWGEEIFACCPYENAVCCKDFEGCCPNSYECEAETQSCVSGTREIGVGNNAPTDPPPTFVCLWPQVQCPNFKCCGEGEQCVEQSGGNYKCLPAGYATCDNGTVGCPQSLVCDKRDDGTFCSEVVDTDIQVKKDIIAKHWGADPVSSCAASCAALAQANLVQTNAQGFVFHPKVLAPEINEPSLAPPPQPVFEPIVPQFWYPQRLAIRSKAMKASNTQLPTLLASKVCQHLLISTNSSLPSEFCYVTNANGHFAMKDRARAAELVAEYSRRLCSEQRCLAVAGRTWSPTPEELDPCPCRTRPTPTVEPVPVEDSAGVDPNAEAVREEIADAEASVAAEQVTDPNLDKPLFMDKVVEVADEKPVSAVGMGVSLGTVPVNAEKPVEDDVPVKFTLVLPTRDDMQLSPPLETEAVQTVDDEMAKSKQAETFMGTEACNGDENEDANAADENEESVVAGSQTAVQLDVVADKHIDEMSWAQMEANSNQAGVVSMPEDE